MTQANIDITQQTEEGSAIDWIEILSVLWSSRKLIAYVTATATVLSIIISLLLPEYFKSTATLLPETEKSKLSALGGISDLAALAGMNVGGEASLAKLYPTIIKSEAVLKNVIHAKYQIPKKKFSRFLKFRRSSAPKFRGSSAPEDKVTRFNTVLGDRRKNPGTFV